MAKTKDLIALAGLAGLAYANRDKLFGGKGKDKEAKGPSATAEEEEASRVRMDAQKNAMSGNRVTNESSYTGTTKNDSNAAKNIGYGGGDDSDKNLRLSSAPVTQSIRSGKSAAEAVAPTKPLDTPTLRTDQLANLSRAVKREAKTKQFADDVPYQESAQKTDALAVASRAAAAADRRRKMAKQGAYKSGGMVSKVSSASSRADGIATKGKTRGKIC